MRSNWLAQHLLQQADAFNHSYRMARQGDPVRFANHFEHFVHQALDPLLINLDHWQAEHKAALTQTAYAAGLTMVRQGWLIAERRSLSETLFQQLLPTWLAGYPEQAPGLMTQLLNALSHLPSQTQQALMLGYWQDCLPAPAATPDALLIFSWMAGLPQFRHAALAAMQRHPELLQRLGLGDLDRFEHPWWQGASKGWYKRPCALGASVWLDGEFSCRPRLLLSAGHTLVQSGSDYWQLHSDAFGQLLIPHNDPTEPNQPISESRWFPGYLARHWHPADSPRQCMERSFDWVVSFHNRYALLIIPKTGAAA